MQQPVIQPTASTSGEFDFAGAWESRDAACIVPMLKQVLDRLVKPASTPSACPPRTAVHKEAVFCRISRLGVHVDAETREKIWANCYVDI